MRVSIIIPVYNAESYLKECLESVCRQTLQELEIICVDDGSTDNSYDTLHNYVRNDKRIKVIRQTNRGPGPARNRGLQEAAGEFIAFLDADDFYMDEDALEKMYQACVRNKVKVCGSALKHLRQGIITDDITLIDVKKAAEKKTVLEYQDFQFDYGYTGFLFSRKTMIENKIIFPPYKRYQDPCFLVRAMYAAGRFIFSDAALYVCRVPTMVSRFSKDKVTDLLKGLYDNLSFAHEKKMDKLFYTSLMRLEYEYYSIICHFVSLADGQTVQLLWEINRFVRQALEDKEYMIRPLSFILSEDIDFYLHYEERLCEKMKFFSSVYIYGAGGLARKFILYLRKKKLVYKIRGIVVSERRESQVSLEDIKISALCELNLNSDEVILIAAGAIFHKEIIDILHNNRLHNYVIIDSVFLESLPEQEGET